MFASTFFVTAAFSVTCLEYLTLIFIKQNRSFLFIRCPQEKKIKRKKMEQTLNWRKGLFDSNYQVFCNALLKFSINFSSLKNSAIATTQQGIYLLKSKGYSNLETKVLNNKNEVLAVIRYDLLGFKAKIFFSTGEEFDWSFQNSWLSRWSINNHKDKQIIYNSSTGNGLIHSNIDDDLLILIGLFIREYYVRILFILGILLFILFTGKGIF